MSQAFTPVRRCGLKRQNINSEGRESNRQPHAIDVWGDLACFTDPLCKAERRSYPVPTPSAARGIFDAIYFHRTQFQWAISRIEILKPVRYVALRRNEVKEVVGVAAVAKWMGGREPVRPILADDGGDVKGRTQRQTMALADVRYRLTGSIRPWPGNEGREREYNEQFLRRLRVGKCFQQPYLGCREFAAGYGHPDPAFQPIDLDLDLGYIPYDIFDLSTLNDAWAKPAISVFRAVVRGGVLEVPGYESKEVLKATG